MAGGALRGVTETLWSHEGVLRHVSTCYSIKQLAKVTKYHEKEAEVWDL